MGKKGGIIALVGLCIIIIAVLLSVFHIEDVKKGVNQMSSTTKETITYSLEGIDSLKIDTRNSRVDFLNSDSDQIEVTYYKGPHMEYAFEKDGNTLSLIKQRERFTLFSFDFTPNHTEIRIPKEKIQNVTIINSNASISMDRWELLTLDARTTNGKITLEDVSAADKLKVVTSNSAITLQNVTSKAGIDAKTSNGTVELNMVTAQKDITAETSNSKIICNTVNTPEKVEFISNNGKCEVTGVQSNNMRVQTSNSGIELERVTIADTLTVKTSNGKVTIQQLDAKTIDITSNNAGVSLGLVEKEDMYDFTANTSNSSIYINNEKVAGDSFSSRTSNRERKLSIHTSNGKIEMNFAQ